MSESNTPAPRRPSVVDVVVVGLAVATVLRPSVPVAVAFTAGALARALERYFVDLARVYRNSSIGAASAATEAAASAKAAVDAVVALERELGARLTRLESRASWADGRTGGGR